MTNIHSHPHQDPPAGLGRTSDFPLLDHPHNGQYLTYLDSAATAQRPTQVTAAMVEFERTTYANVHRGVYTIAQEATSRFEAARSAIGRFIGAPVPAREIVFTKNATEAINLVAHTWAHTNLHSGDVIVLTELEHHANIVPWLQLAKTHDLTLRWIPIDSKGRLDLTDQDTILDGAKLLALTGMSNVLGTIPEISLLTESAHAAGALVLLDAAQSAAHTPTDVSTLGVDFMVFSAHKLLGPTGIGVLWARADLLDAMPPFLGGGEMILDVRKDGFTPNETPWRFEAGTPPITQAIGFAAALDYLSALDLNSIATHTTALTNYALTSLTQRFGDSLTLFGPPDTTQRGPIISFALSGLHPHDIAQVANDRGVCLRAGHHCAKPLLRTLGVPATTRASFSLYNTPDDIDKLTAALVSAQRLFG
jgi:cysteine desulfurase/selenocysteine lyase